MKINRTPEYIEIQSPYSPDLPKRAKNISGRWDSSKTAWIFPAAASPQVEELYRDIYGEWDDKPADLVTLRCECDEGDSVYTSSLTLGGRIIARAYGRDSGAKTADGVIVLTGGFGSGGSVKNWLTICRPRTSFRLLNVPRLKAESLVDDPEWCSKIEIEQPEQKTEEEIDRDALIAERTRLSARITEIDAILHQ